MGSAMRWRTVIIALLHLSARMTNAFDPATVLHPNCDDLQPRIEIRDLAKDRDQWEVFVLGLKHMQEANTSDSSSYHAIASA